jgi:Flp pilus assembly protein TadG
MAKGAAARGLEKGRAGQSLAELSIVLVLFVVVTFGIVDAGRMIFAYNAVSLSAREGVRYAIVRGSASVQPATVDDIRTYVRSKTVGVPVDVAVNWPDGAADPGKAVEVTVTSRFTPVTPFAPGSINLASTSRMLISR